MTWHPGELGSLQLDPLKMIIPLNSQLWLGYLQDRPDRFLSSPKVRTCSAAQQPSYSAGKVGSILEVMGPGREAYHPSPSSIELKKEWS